MDDASSRSMGGESRPLSVLVVDDSRDTRKVLSMALEFSGYRVSVAGNGMEALEILQQQPHDLVLTDLWMPNMDGAELVRLLRLNPATAATPIVLMTASCPPQLRDSVAADAFMTKPFEFEPLLKLLASLSRPASMQPASNDASHQQDLAL
jgi:two-component system response regulator MprA